MLNMQSIRQAAANVVQIVWGEPQTLAGFALFLVHSKRPHFIFHGAVVTTWESLKALSLGPFIFINGPDDPDQAEERVDKRLLVHEYGHTLQSLVLGPLYLLVIGLPSVAWLNVPALSRWRNRKQLSYYRFYTERSANWLGELALKEPSVGSDD